MYKKLWDFVEKHVRKSLVIPAFLSSLMAGWTVTGLLLGAVGCLLMGTMPLITRLTVLLCAGGYSCMILGFFGGIFYLYRISFNREPHPESSSVKIPQQRKSCQY